MYMYIYLYVYIEIAINHSGSFGKNFVKFKNNKYVIYRLRVGPYGEKLWTILSSLQACFVIAHSSGDFINIP